MPGSEPKSKPLVVRGGGSGRSTPPQVLPPSLEKRPRMGRRSISFAPATIWLGLVGLIAIDVSLWGPGSLLASTFLPTETLFVRLPSPADVNPGAETTWYFAHQVGFVGSPPAAPVCRALRALSATMLKVDASPSVSLNTRRRRRSAKICPSLRHP